MTVEEKNLKNEDFKNIGEVTSEIPVEISYRIIELFSEGLYSSPNKAIEELVANSFDAGAGNVHVIISPDRSSSDSIIAVIDDGNSMDEEGLRQHWLIGVSNKRTLSKLPKGRKQIGKFGIGKLATFALGNELTHICKINGRFFAVTMDYTKMPEGISGGIGVNNDNKVSLPFRELSEDEAKKSIPLILTGSKPGFQAIRLFGDNALDSWTIAIISNLKDLAKFDLKLGMLSWVLRTSMPLRDDFTLYLNGDLQETTKIDQSPLKKWVIGKDIQQLGLPADGEEIQAFEIEENGEVRIGLVHPTLGEIIGFAEVYKNILTTEGNFGHSHGFFIKVRDRLINTIDPHFGIPSNALRHGTFSRFRMVVQIDNLDEELRSTREDIRKASLNEAAQNILKAIFNIARNYLEEFESENNPSFRAENRIKQSPRSLTRQPIVFTLQKALSGNISPKYIKYPKGLSEEDILSFIEEINLRSSSESGLVNSIEHNDIGIDARIAILDLESGILQLNSLHPFIAAYREDFEKDDTLFLLCMAEVLTEAFLYECGQPDNVTHDVMTMRDELLRHFAKSMKRTANSVAVDLVDAVTQQSKLELEIVEAFNSMGFEAIHLGKSNEPDGIATAYLSGSSDNKVRKYSINLEAKSKERIKKRVQSKDVDIKRVSEHSKKYKCEHALIVGPDFATTKGEESALIIDARDEIKNSGRTITFMKATDLAKLVRIRALKHLGLDRIQEIFTQCVTPEEVTQHIEELANLPLEGGPYEDLLNTIWKRQQDELDVQIHFSSVKTALRIEKRIDLSLQQIEDLCRSMSTLAPNEIIVRTNSVELTQRPDIILEAIKLAVSHYPDNERKRSPSEFL